MSIKSVQTANIEQKGYNTKQQNPQQVSFGSTTITEKFVEYFKEYNLAFGAILYAILAILGGGLGILSKIKK